MIFVTVERAPLSSTTSRWLGDFTFFQYNRSPPYLLSILAITLGAVFFAWSQTNGGQAKKSELVPGTWELSPVSNSPKVHKISRSFREGTSFLLLTIRRKGSCFIQSVAHAFLNGSSYTEHVDFGDRISAGIVGKDQQFTVKIDGDTFMQAGTLSNGKGLSETWKRVSRER